MKNIFRLFLVSFVLISCKKEAKKEIKDLEVKTEISKKSNEVAYNNFGKQITDADVLTSEQMLSHYNTLKEGDTVNIKMKGKITDVCSKKGCWMKLNVGDDKIVRVTFKDYGFFMPLDAEGDVVVNGKAFVKEISVADLQHYAEDAGKSVEEIAKITEPEVTMSFEADGVLLAK